MSFDPIRFYCCDIQLESNSDQLKENFVIVLPVCTTCYRKGLQPATKNAKDLI